MLLRLGWSKDREGAIKGVSVKQVFNFVKFTGKQLLSGSLFNKVEGLHLRASVSKDVTCKI